MSDMVERLEEADANRPAGDKSGLGIVQIIAGGVQDSSSANSSFVFRTIGENPVGLAKRLDSFDYLADSKTFLPHAEICLYGAVMLFIEIISQKQ